MAFEFPASFRFADSHEYANADGELVRVGISAFAVDQLGDIVFVDLPDVGATLAKGTSFGSCLLYTSPSPRDRTRSRMPSSA